jgi:hypothetical protein
MAINWSVVYGASKGVIGVGLGVKGGKAGFSVAGLPRAAGALVYPETEPDRVPGV